MKNIKDMTWDEKHAIIGAYTGWETSPDGKAWKSPHARAYFKYRKPWTDSSEYHYRKTLPYYAESMDSVRYAMSELPDEKVEAILKLVGDGDVVSVFKATPGAYVNAFVEFIQNEKENTPRPALAGL